MATWNATGGAALGLAALGVAFFHQPDAVTLALARGILDLPAPMTASVLAALCGDDAAFADFVAGYSTFVLGGLARPSVARSFRALDTVGDDVRLLRIANDLVPCVNSFSADIPVATADGTTPISDIRVGDVVRGFDESTGTTGLCTVTAVIGGTTTRYVQDLAAPLSQVLSDGTASYVYGAERLAGVTGGVRTW